MGVWLGCPTQCFFLPEVGGQVLGPDTGVRGSLRPQLFGSEQAVQAVQDAGEAHRLPPQGGRDRVDGTQLRYQDLGGAGSREG